MIYLRDADSTLFHGDMLAVLPEVLAESVDCVVTSPPYWGLRDYGQEGQLGLEPTFEQYVERMVKAFREVRRVLAPHGTMWLNLGDSYTASTNGGPAQSDKTTMTGGRKVFDLPARARGTLKPKDLVGIPWRVAFALQCGLLGDPDCPCPDRTSGAAVNISYLELAARRLQQQSLFAEAQ